MLRLEGKQHWKKQDVRLDWLNYYAQVNLRHSSVFRRNIGEVKGMVFTEIQKCHPLGSSKQPCYVDLSTFITDDLQFDVHPNNFISHLFYFMSFIRDVPRWATIFSPHSLPSAKLNISASLNAFCVVEQKIHFLLRFFIFHLVLACKGTSNELN